MVVAERVSFLCGFTCEVLFEKNVFVWFLSAASLVFSEEDGATRRHDKDLERTYRAFLHYMHILW